MIFRHLSRSVASCDAPAMSSLVHSFKSWNQVVAGLPLLRLPSIFPCISLFSIPFFRTIWPKNLLPLRHTLSQHQNRPNLLQHPFVRFPLCPWHPKQSSITPHFESINTLLVTTCHRPWFTAVNGYGKSSGPKEPHFESQTHTSALPYRHQVLHCSPTHRQPPPDFLCTTAFVVDKTFPLLLFSLHLERSPLSFLCLYPPPWSLSFVC